MRVSHNKPGHSYHLFMINPDPNAENNGMGLEFQDGAVKEIGKRNGWQNEEVLAVLIDRMKFLNGKFSCRENSIVITKLQEALMWLEKRTADRKNRGVEGQDKV